MKVTGVVCDNCGKFIKETEVGYIRFEVQTNHGNPADHFDLCGNSCLAVIANARAKEEGVKVPRYTSPETKKKFAYNARKMQHGRWHGSGHEQKGFQEDCEFCLEEATNPENGK